MTSEVYKKYGVRTGMRITDLKRKYDQFLPKVCKMMNVPIDSFTITVTDYIPENSCYNGCYYPAAKTIAVAAMNTYQLHNDSRITGCDPEIFLLCHELQHHKQYMENKFDRSLPGVVRYSGQNVVLPSTITYEEYNNFPWEVEANEIGLKVAREIYKNGYNT